MSISRISRVPASASIPARPSERRGQRRMTCSTVSLLFPSVGLQSHVNWIPGTPHLASYAFRPINRLRSCVVIAASTGLSPSRKAAPFSFGFWCQISASFPCAFSRKCRSHSRVRKAFAMPLLRCVLACLCGAVCQVSFAGACALVNGGLLSEVTFRGCGGFLGLLYSCVFSGSASWDLVA